MMQTAGRLVGVTAGAAGAAGALACCEGENWKPADSPSKSFWLDSKRWREPKEMHTPLAGLPTSTDVVVIGAGLSGAGAALSLAESGIGVTLIDARGVSGGASGRNGGFLGGATWSQLPVLLAEQEPRHAIETIRLKRYNLDYIRRFCHERAVDADLDRGVDGLQFFSSKEALDDRVGWWRYVRQLLRPFGVEIIEGEAEMASQLRMRPGSTLDAYGAVRLRRDFDTICASRFVVAAVEAAIELGASVHTHSEGSRIRTYAAAALQA